MTRPTLGRCACTAAFLLSISACAPTVQRAPVRSQPESASGVPPNRALKRPVGEEKLGRSESSSRRDRAGIAEAETAPPPASPPDPQTILASIGPATPPPRAASLRLTDDGRRLFDNGDGAAALDRLEKAVKIDPSNPHAYYWLAQVHFQRGRPDQALAFSDKSIVLFSSSERGWLAQAYTFRASVLERTGRFPEARDSYQRAVRVEPGNVAARAGLARLGDVPALDAR